MKTAGTYDHKLMLIDSTADVTASVTGSAVDFNGADMDELNIRVIVPSAAGTNPVLKVEYQESEDGSDNWTTVYTFPEIKAAGEYSKKIRAKERYRRINATVSGTGANFGKVLAGASTGGVL